MNLDELAAAIGKVSRDRLVQGLARLLVDWKGDDRTAQDLKQTVERYLGNTWMEKDEDFARVHHLWSAFSNVAVSGIGGMTMNERLYWFSLIERFDASPDEAAKRVVYRKLHARP